MVAWELIPTNPYSPAYVQCTHTMAGGKSRVTTTLENRENRENSGNVSGLENSGKTQGILSVLREFLFLRFFKIIKKNC